VLRGVPGRLVTAPGRSARLAPAGPWGWCRRPGPPWPAG